MNRREFSLSALLSLVPTAKAFQVTPTEFNRFARWWCDLNCFRWPLDFGEPPDWIKEKFALQGRACYEMHKERYHALVEGIAVLTDDETIKKYWNEIYIKDPSRFQYGKFPRDANLRG